MSTNRAAAVVLAVALSVGCSAPRRPPVPAPTPLWAGPIAGITATAADHSVVLRELYLGDPGPDRAAPLSFQLWNNTGSAISLTGATVPEGGVVDLTFEVAVPGRGHLALGPPAGRHLEIRCLPADVKPGGVVAMSFTFSNGATIAAGVPVGAIASAHGAPTAPASRTATCR
jgi:hypothetical protein